MQTRSGKKLPPSKPHQTFKEVRIPSKKRHVSVIDWPQLQGDAPASKKQKSPKAVRFEHHADGEDGVPRYESPYSQDSLESEKESGPSEELLRRISIEVDEFLAESEEGDQVELLELNEAEQCAMNTTEDLDNNKLVANRWEALDERTIVSRIDDFHDEGEDDLLDQRVGIPENNNYRPIQKKQKDAVIDIVSSNSSPTDQIDKNREYNQRYLNLKTTAWHWSSIYFSPPTPSPAFAPPSLNLPDLCHTSPQLMEYANYVSVCTDSLTWEDVFNEQRILLVYSILGKMIEVHVFGHEMFGATDEQLCILRAADEECMMDDGFLRRKQRADDISAFLGGNPLQQAPENTFPSNFLASLSRLQASFLQMLSPLLSPLTPKQSHKLTRQLSTILLAAATLSLSIRRDTSTIYHWHMHPAPGSLYSSETMHILDRDSAKEGWCWREATDMRVVTMAGWPSCVAYGPTTSGNGEDCTRVVGRAEVLVRWEARVAPLAVRPTDWLGPSLRIEMRRRRERRDKEERMAVVGSGLAVGASLAMGWAIQQPWVVDTVKGYVGL